MKRFLLTLAVTLFLAGTASAQNFFESRERSRQFQRDVYGSGRPSPGGRQWRKDLDNIEEARELDKMRNSQDRDWQGSGSGIRSNR